MHHIFIDENFIDINNSIIKLEKSSDKENYNHLVNVLRIKPGELILCSAIPFTYSFDYKCKVSVITNDGVEFTIEEKTKANELGVNINLYQGISKGDKLDFIIEKAVELGVKEIIPVAMEYSVAKIEEKKEEAKLLRFNKIARSAAEQSKRNIIPEVKKSLSFTEMVNELKGQDETTLLFYENAEGIQYTKDVIKVVKDDSQSTREDDKTLNVIIGPEGGFSDKEINLAKEAGFHILSLGDRILRTETAAITALSILMYEFAK